MQEIIFAHNEDKGKIFLEKLRGKEPLFVCVLGTTETAKIQGLSAAGKNPELTDFTPPADVELLLLGKCKCIQGVPMTPEGIPTPAIITRAALSLGKIPTLVVNGGLRIKPHVPFVELGGKPGKDIRSGKAVENASAVVEKAEILGETLADVADYLVIGESIPGGTTTALGILTVMGIEAKGKMSSSMPNNPHELKTKVVEEAMKASNLKFGDLATDPINAITHLGDPMMPAFSGLVIGAASNVPVLMAGGTQMAAILAIVKALKPEVLGNVAIATTRWIVNDSKADLKGLVSQIADAPIMAINLNFTQSRFEGLRAYEEGAVKEGVGAGGACIAAVLKSNFSIKVEDLFMEIERIYNEELLT